MTAEEKAHYAIALDAHFRNALRTTCCQITENEEERADLATATVTLILRRLYQDRGQVYLEAIIKAVLQ